MQVRFAIHLTKQYIGFQQLINGIGVIIESINVLIFLVFPPKKEKAKILGLFLFILSMFSTVAVVSVFAFKEESKRQLVCGLAATVCSIIMYASPISVTRLVIQTKSVKYVPFLLSLSVFLCATSWFVYYGLIGNNKFIYTRSGIGCLLGAMQLILYGIYRKKKEEEVEKPTAVDGSLEMR